MSFWRKKPERTELALELEKAEKYVEKQTERLNENREEHHKLLALSPIDTIRAYVILAEKRGK